MNTPVESKSQDRPLTVTSYAVLAVLALRDHSTYELAKQMRLSLHYFWPRAESNVYAEPKRLVRARLALRREEWTGGRRRTVYAISDAGRAALTDWLATASNGQRYESEALVKLFFGENGSMANMLATIRAVGEEAAAALAHWQGIADVYGAGEGAYPNRFALTGLVARLLGEQQAATARWAAWAEVMVSRWHQSSAADVDWGVKTIRATGEPFEGARKDALGLESPVSAQPRLEP